MRFFLIIAILIFHGCAGSSKKSEVSSLKKNPEVEVKKEVSTKEAKENKITVEPETTKKVEVTAATTSVPEKPVEKQSTPAIIQQKEAEAAIKPVEIKKEQTISEGKPKEENISSVKSVEATISVQAERKEVDQKSLPVSVEKPATSKPEATQKTTSVQNKVNGKDESDSKDVIVIKIPNKNVNGTSAFSPEVLHIKHGQKVMWVNEDERTHFINKKPEFNAKALKSYGDDDDEDEGTKKVEQKGTGFSNSPLLPKGKKWIFEFKEPGTISYYCFTHPLEMRGKIIVE